MHAVELSPNGEDPELSLFSDDYPWHDDFVAEIYASAVPVVSKLADTVESYGSAITVNELAKILQCSRGQVYKWIEQKRLPAIKIGTMVRLDPSAVAAWIRDRVT
jgi:excisionase family DNA binding protein